MSVVLHIYSHNSDFITQRQGIGKRPYGETQINSWDWLPNTVRGGAVWFV